MTSPRTILVVEDNDFVRMQMVSFLQGVGHTTVEATDGHTALEAMNKNISLAIVDVRMEPLGGFEFLNMIRSENYKTPVILVTGDNDPSLLERAGKGGVSMVLMKPVQKERLLNSVSRLLEREGK